MLCVGLKRHRSNSINIFPPSFNNLVLSLVKLIPRCSFIVTLIPQQCHSSPYFFNILSSFSKGIFLRIIQVFSTIFLVFKSNSDGFSFSQHKPATKLLERAQMLDAKPMTTLTSFSSPLFINNGLPFSNLNLYYNIIGGLQCLTFTHPNIAYLVNSICQNMYASTNLHQQVIKWILRYFKSTTHLVLQLKPTTLNSLISYSDAN